MIIGEINEAIAYINQEANEKRYNRKHIDGYIRDEINASPMLTERVDIGVAMLEHWMSLDWYESKRKRLDQLHGLDLRELVMDLFVGLSYFIREELFTSVTAQLAGKLRFSDKPEAIKTTAEIIAVLSKMDVFAITKKTKQSSLMLVSYLPLSPKLKDFIDQSEYLPPMVCEPRKLTSNYSSGYLSHNDSLILKAGNHHDGDICLDVLNLMNRVKLSLNLEFLSTVEEMPSEAPNTQEQLDNWNRFKKQSYRFYELMVSQGNCFYLCHKVDKRGRIYASGYHISTMGSSFKKASIELHKKEFIEGVPTS
jgi:hypothetical protein